MEQTYAIELKNITKRFGKIVANDGINLQVKRGEILSLLGENGSGKTTLMNMISGIYFPDEGHIFVDGKEVWLGNAKMMAARNISYTENSSAGTVIYVAVDGAFAGTIVISDSIKAVSYTHLTLPTKRIV
mgnify:CR=1 FL=1